MDLGPLRETNTMRRVERGRRGRMCGAALALAAAALPVGGCRRTPRTAGPLPGMPAVLEPRDIYSADRPGLLSAVVRAFPPRVYVPNSDSDTVSEISTRLPSLRRRTVS